MLLSGCVTTRKETKRYIWVPNPAVQRSTPSAGPSDAREVNDQEPVQPPFPVPDSRVREAYREMGRRNRQIRIRAIPHEIKLLKDQITLLKNRLFTERLTQKEQQALVVQIMKLETQILEKKAERRMCQVEEGEQDPGF